MNEENKTLAAAANFKIFSFYNRERYEMQCLDLYTVCLYKERKEKDKSWEQFASNAGTLFLYKQTF